MHAFLSEKNVFQMQAANTANLRKLQPPVQFSIDETRQTNSLISHAEYTSYTKLCELTGLAMSCCRVSVTQSQGMIFLICPMEHPPRNRILKPFVHNLSKHAREERQNRGKLQKHKQRENQRQQPKKSQVKLPKAPIHDEDKEDEDEDEMQAALDEQDEEMKAERAGG